MESFINYYQHLENLDLELLEEYQDPWFDEDGGKYYIVDNVGSGDGDRSGTNWDRGWVKNMCQMLLSRNAWLIL